MNPYSRNLTLALLAILAAGCTTTAPRASRAPVGAEMASAQVARDDAADERFRAALQMMRTRPDTAREELLALSREYPSFSGPLTNLGILYASGRQRGDAVASFSQAVSANPNNAVALNWLGTLYRETGDFGRAEAAYLKALEVQPNYAAAHLNLAILYELALGRPQQALEHYRDYRDQADDPRLIVSAWIKELETKGVPSPATSVASAQMTP